MRVAFFSTHTFDREFFDQANVSQGHDLYYLESRLTPATATLAGGCPVVCAFVSDQLDEDVLASHWAGGTRMIALRSAGFNHVDLTKGKSWNFAVARVPAYSPHAVAEHTIALILTLNRKIHRAYAHIRAYMGISGDRFRTRIETSELPSDASPSFPYRRSAVVRCDIAVRRATLASIRQPGVSCPQSAQRSQMRLPAAWRR